MSQTLTKPILLDETGQAIKTALQNIDETEDLESRIDTLESKIDLILQTIQK